MAENMPSGVSMSYRETGGGTGDPLVLLHAFPLNGKMFEGQMATLSTERRVVCPDYPGFGRSPHTPAEPDIRYYAEGVGRLLDRLEVERCVLGGVSMGGYVAFGCLRLFPERISALVLCNTRPDADAEEARQTRKQAARRVADEGVGVLVELQLERLLAKDTLQNQPETVEKVEAMILECSPDGAVAALGAMRERPDSTELLPEVSVPTLVVGGSEDPICPPDVMGEMAQKIPGARHTTLDGTGHLSNLEDPSAFDAALSGFLAEL